MGREPAKHPADVLRLIGLQHRLDGVQSIPIIQRLQRSVGSGEHPVGAGAPIQRGLGLVKGQPIGEELRMIRWPGRFSFTRSKSRVSMPRRW